ncbi:hypothetical protein Acr_10g0009560 [Actinidia rufa]|uniref:Uncharacterized protein n=1 Tax=Actinidia rufa TaxID=165716 RepID=A0A7J0FA99_9ERIC|nr:hypothetical protein Acr_10g0009560 [Actinidia rufa]
MWVARFLSGLSPSFDVAQSQILGAKELPSIGEVFCRCRAGYFTIRCSFIDRSALAAFSGPSRLPGRPNCPSSDYPCDSRSFGRGARDSGNVVVVIVVVLVLHSLQPGQPYC